MFRYEHVNLTRKYTIVAEIVSLLRKIYKRDAPFRAMFEVKTLAVLFPPYPREMKTNTRNLNLPPCWRLFVSMEMVQPIPTRALSRARGLSKRTHLTIVWSWCSQRSNDWARARFKHFRSLSRFITQNFHGQPPTLKPSRARY